jgi:hypothetical protein
MCSSDTISQNRETCIQLLLTTLYRLNEDIQAGQKGCGELSCQKMLLGTLLWEMQSKGLVNPHPLPPFEGCRFDVLCESFCNICVPMWYAGDSSYTKPHKCQIKPDIEPDIRALKLKVKGLILEHFLPKVRWLRT